MWIWAKYHSVAVRDKVNEKYKTYGAYIVACIHASRVGVVIADIQNNGTRCLEFFGDAYIQHKACMLQ